MQRGNALNDIGAELRVGQRALRPRRMDKRRSDGIYRNVVLTPLDRQAFRQVHDGRFCHAVHGFRRKSGKSGLRTHVNDAAATLLDHHASGQLAREERPFQVDAQCKIEVLFPYILGGIFGCDAGVVDKNVEPSKVSDGRVDRGADLLHLAHIHLERQNTSAHGPDFVADVTGSVYVAQTKGNVRAGVS